MRSLSKVLVLFITSTLCWCFSINIAFAEEIILEPVDTFELYSSSPQSNQLIQEVEKLASSLPTSSKYILGYDSVPDSVYLYSSSGFLSGYLDPVHSGIANNFGDWTLSYNNLIITLDMSGNTDGYYRYSCDFYFGVAGGFSQYANISNRTIDLTPGYTYNSVPLYISDSESGMHCTVYLVGEVEYDYEDRNTNSSGYAVEKYSLIHGYMESTFYYDSSYGTDVVFNLSPWFDNNISSLSIDCSGLRSTLSRTFYFYGNNRVKSSLVGNVDPPVTPTPSPTPYPGQDTQESINAGVQQIVTDLSVYATPVPTPGEISLDPTTFDYLDDLTLPDVSEGSRDISNMWLIFTPAVGYLTLFSSSIFVVSIFIYIIRGGWL